MDFAIPTDHWVKKKKQTTTKNEKIEKYLDVAREQKELLNMRVAVILIVIR